MKYIIFSDIDGTIYPSTKVIHHENITEINRAQDEGIEFIICTGNGYFNSVANLSEKLNARYAITSNGASIFDREINDYIFKATIEKGTINEMLNFANINKISSCFWDTENMYINSHATDEVIRILNGVMTLNKDKLVRDEVESNVFKIVFYDTKEKVDLVEKYISKFDLQIARMDDTHLEVTSNNISKGSAIKWICNQMDWDIKNTMGIGDSANDLPMFKEVEHSYAMGNSPEYIKQSTRYIVKSVELGGLADGIKHFRKIKADVKN